AAADGRPADTVGVVDEGGAAGAAGDAEIGPDPEDAEAAGAALHGLLAGKPGAAGGRRLVDLQEPGAAGDDVALATADRGAAGAAKHRLRARERTGVGFGVGPAG